MDEIIRVEEKYFILSTSSLADDRTRVLKHGETFAVFDRRGDVEPLGKGFQGVYHEGTRYLSQWVLRLGRQRPLLLSSGVRIDNAALTVDFTNTDIRVNGRVVIPHGTLHIERSKFLWDGTHYEKLQIANYSLSPVQCSMSIRLAADFADTFEVRGIRRERRGARYPDEVKPDEIMLTYCGLDDVVRRTWIRCSPQPRCISSSEIVLDVCLQPKGQQTYILTACCGCPEHEPRLSVYDVAAGEAARKFEEPTEETHIYTGNEQFNEWLNRSTADLHILVTETPYGKYPYGGIPWFSNPFGRDGIITALETLWLNPPLARGVLSFLAATQAKQTIPEIDAEPGKIVHEMRYGEMAAVGEVPFGRYYGSVDSTPLFVMLAGAYYRRTADLVFIEKIWPNVEAALRWMEEYGDIDGDGFVEYSRRSPNGLIHQGWKDSNDSIFHAGGQPAEGPIAVCEVQSYVYAAKRAAAVVAAALGKLSLSQALKEQARSLQLRFEEAFWCEDLSTYALALDGDKKPCRVRASNAGHCLFTGIARRERARLVSHTLLADDFFSGWGIRTVSSRENRYNPMSYHNGSIWPHDNALIARGFSRYGLRHETLKILTALLDASLFLDLHRLPELFCGFPRRPGQGPTLYPVACAPQAWAAGAVLLILEACLGIRIQASPPRVLFRHTVLPPALPKVEIRNLKVGSASVDLAVERTADGVFLRILRKVGEVDIVSIK